MQKTRDELNRLKGENGKPKFPVPKKNKDISSENERKTPIPRGERKSKEKLSKIKINVTEDCRVDPSILPEDAKFKYYDTVVVQDIIITRKTLLIVKKFGIPPHNIGHIAELPHGMEGEFAPSGKNNQSRRSTRHRGNFYQ